MSKRKTHAAHLGCSCPHLEGLTQHKKKKLLDAIWANATRKTDDASTLAGATPTTGLQCVTCGRLSADADAHRAAHPGKRLPAGHELALDLSTNEIFCVTCADYVYCPDIDRTVTSLVNAQRPTPAADTADAPAADAAEPMDRDPSSTAVLHVDLTTEDATKVEAKGSDGSGPSSTVAPPAFRPLPPTDAFPPGLRGLNNMGHTCFMNSILQAFIHAPLLPEHHLAQGHRRGQCPLAADGDACVACEMDRVFSEAFSGDRSPHSPSAFLHAWWTLAGGDLGGGCKQQDAHEFFLFVLEMLVAVTGRDSVIARLFEGSLRSDVVCDGCGAVSTTSDHFTHLSLDIPPPTRLLPPPILPRPSGGAGNGRAGGSSAAGAKGSKQLVGAAKAAHLARLNKKQAGRAGEPTPEPSSQAFGDGATATLTLDESAASEAAGAEALGATATSGAAPRPSPPPPGFVDARLSEPQPEQASGIDAVGAAVAGSAADTLSSPRRTAAAAEEPPRDSTSPSTDVATNPTAATAAAGTAPGCGTAAAATAAGQLAHPALAGYLHWPGASLVGCLRRFVWPEHLGAGRGWRCPGCGESGAAVKQLTLARLPPILVMHAKRFEHSGGPRASAKKLDTYLSFPLEGLDMSPFLTSAALQKRHVPRPTPPPTATMPSPKAGPGPKSPARSGGATMRRTRSLAAAAETKERSAAGGGARSTAMTRSASAAAAIGRDTAAARAPADGDASAAPSSAPQQPLATLPPPASSLYDLFAVVCHRGTFQGGHYVAYVRAAGDGRWYLCDDAYVAPVPEETVRTSQAYMLFYGQRDLLPWSAGSGEHGGV